MKKTLFGLLLCALSVIPFGAASLSAAVTPSFDNGVSVEKTYWGRGYGYGRGWYGRGWYGSGYGYGNYGYGYGSGCGCDSCYSGSCGGCCGGFGWW